MTSRTQVDGHGVRIGAFCQRRADTGFVNFDGRQPKIGSTSRDARQRVRTVQQQAGSRQAPSF
jgi:hypothetical protein